MDLGIFQKFCQEVHRKSDVIICITTGGAPEVAHAVSLAKTELREV